MNDHKEQIPNSSEIANMTGFLISDNVSLGIHTKQQIL